jgi:hypothetical protein
LCQRNSSRSRTFNPHIFEIGIPGSHNRQFDPPVDSLLESEGRGDPAAYIDHAHSQECKERGDDSELERANAFRSLPQAPEVMPIRCSWLSIVHSRDR